MSPNERRQELLEVLCRRRRDTYSNLAQEFGVSKRTIQNDILSLSCSYPIETVSGNGGGIKIADWYHLNRKTLNPDQVALLKKLGAQLQGEDLATLNSIISDFAPY